jgi:hypothetical protein
MQVAGQCEKGRGWPFVANNSLIRRTLRVEFEEETIGRPDDQRVGVNPMVSAIIRWVNPGVAQIGPVLANRSLRPPPSLTPDERLP